MGGRDQSLIKYVSCSLPGCLTYSGAALTGTGTADAAGRLQKIGKRHRQCHGSLVVKNVGWISIRCFLARLLCLNQDELGWVRGTPERADERVGECLSLVLKFPCLLRPRISGEWSGDTLALRF
jgi:hypothetical protein